MAKTKKDPLYSEIYLWLGRAMAYHRMGKKSEATFWANKLVAKLQEMELLSNIRGVDKSH